jgi:pimeloyl-ACP methyl ester carboxylesterase
MMQKPVQLVFYILVSLALLTACGKTTEITTPPESSKDIQVLPAKTQSPLTDTLVPPKPTQSTLEIKPGLISGYVDMGGRNLYIICLGEGTPTVIFEAGLGADHSTWYGALAEVSKHTLACAYDRAGLGKSDPSPKGPRTIQDMVDDLHALLTDAPIPGPYILVGHSLGGLNIRLYASQFPQDVIGLVFVDGRPPDFENRVCAAMPTESPHEDASFKQARLDCEATPLPVTDWSLVPEGLDLSTSDEQARLTGPFGDLPLVVLVAQFSVTGQSGTAQGLSAEISNKMQQELAELSTQGKYITVEYANHFDIVERQVVWDAIIKMVSALQNK